MKRTLVLVLSRNGFIHASIAGFFAEACDPDTTPMPMHRFYYYPVLGVVDSYEFARNIGLAEFYEKPDFYDYVLFIDDDQIVNKSVFELYKHEYPIVCGRYLNPRYDERGLGLFVTTFDSLDKETGAFVTMSAGQSEPKVVHAGPGGCMLIDAKVLRDERIRCGEPNPNTPNIIPVFRREIRSDGSVAMGEDINFCVRAAELGYETYYVPQCSVGHWKLMDMMAVEVYGRRIAKESMCRVIRNPEVRDEIQRLCDKEDEVARLGEQGDDAQAGNT